MRRRIRRRRMQRRTMRRSRRRRRRRRRRMRRMRRRRMRRRGKQEWDRGDVAVATPGRDNFRDILLHCSRGKVKHGKGNKYIWVKFTRVHILSKCGHFLVRFEALLRPLLN